MIDRLTANNLIRQLYCRCWPTKVRPVVASRFSLRHYCYSEHQIDFSVRVLVALVQPRQDEVEWRTFAMVRKDSADIWNTFSEYESYITLLRHGVSLTLEAVTTECSIFTCLPFVVFVSSLCVHLFYPPTTVDLINKPFTIVWCTDTLARTAFCVSVGVWCSVHEHWAVFCRHRDRERERLAQTPYLRPPALVTSLLLLM